MKLSERRAGAVQRALQDMGVGRDRVSMRGYGVAYPVAANDDASVGGVANDNFTGFTTVE